MNDDARMLAGRYEVGNLIGRGGMAEVHIGYDTRLGRTVAIKILRADLARDPSFQTRFRREAQAAAGLNHPAIVAVYDTGEDSVAGASGTPQAVPFIVMEYVEGHTVRDILKGDVAAPIDEAVEIVSGVLSALDYSHHAGLVHRDIKPANVMLTPTGAVKVMDFGIARALADAGNTMTQTQAVVGTAQYLSPEQARGEAVDARSDLYSTGCLLFELLTGRPPFVGDSPVSVAYQHVREAPPQPSTYASDVPEALDKIVLRALAKNRDERYASAQEFLSDLRAVMAGDPVDPSTGAIGVGAAALGSAAMGAGVAGVMAAHSAEDREAIASQATQAMPAVPGDATGATAVMPAGAAAGAAVGAAAASPWAATGADLPGSVAPQGASTMTADVDTIDEDDEKARRRKQYWILAGAAAAAILIVVALLLFTRGGTPEDPAGETATVPDLVGLTEAQARIALEEVDLLPIFEEEPSDTIEEGLVTRSDPEATTAVDRGSEITVYLSSGPDVGAIPDVLGLTQEEAIKAINDAGFTLLEVKTEDNTDQAQGIATRTDPAAGETAEAGSALTLYVSSGMVDVPSVVGMTQAEATTALEAVGLTAAVTPVETTKYPVGQVFKQDPSTGQVKLGDPVALSVAAEVTNAKVPNVIGKSQSAAEKALVDAGFKVNVRNGADPAAAGTVYQQSPDADTTLDLDSTVTIWVSTGPVPEPTATA